MLVSVNLEDLNCVIQDARRGGLRDIHLVEEKPQTGNDGESSAVSDEDIAYHFWDLQGIGRRSIQTVELTWDLCENFDVSNHDSL